MTGGNYPPNVNSPEKEDWKKRLKSLGIVRKRRKRGNKKEDEEIPLRTLQKLRSGREGEDIASSLLEENSLLILDRNVRYKDGEIDIVALDGATTVFIEVKRRRDAALGTPAEAVSPAKQRRIRGLAVRFLRENPGTGRGSGRRGRGGIRFDVVSILDGAVQVIEAAF